MTNSPALDAVAGIVHRFGRRDDDMGRRFQAYWPHRPVQHERHGTRIAIALHAGEDCGEADGMFTEQPGLMLAIATADCAPVLLARKDGTAVAALHVGWRGALAGIVPEFAALLARCGERTGDWVAAIGPTAGPCCYEVSDDIIASFRERYPIDPRVIAPRHRRLDVARIVQWQLGSAGFGQVGACVECTMCHTVDTAEVDPVFAYHSYRRDSATRSPGIDVQWSVVAIAPRDKEEK